jgi:hypothetical protein
MSLIDTASLIVTPNAYKEGKLYSVIPSDGSGDMSVTRATTATRVNSAGLVELVPYNLVQYSEQFDNGASWGQVDVVLSGNQTTAPNGTNTADKFTINTASFEHVVFNSTNYVNQIGQWTTSVYLKKGNSDYVQLANNGATAANFAYIVINLNNGVVTQSAGSGSYTLNSYVVTSVGNGWYRCSITYTNTSDEVRGIRIRFSNSATPTISDYGSILFTGNGTDFFYAWGAQFNSGTLKDYQKTETRLNIPRLDYSNGTCPSLLVEPQRTNILNYSEDFENGYWYEEPGNSVTSNTTISPSGIQNADTFTAVGGSEMNIHNYATFPLTTGTYTYSVYLKNNGTNLIEVYLFKIGSGFAARGEINFSAGTFTASVGTGTIQELDNGWYRVNLTNSVTAGDFTTGVYSTSTTGTRSVFVWGAQLEAGNYSTSFIPTTSASVTRNADVISKTGISSLIGQTEGTVFLEYPNFKTDGNEGLVGIDDGSGNNRILFYSDSNNRITAQVRTNGVTQQPSSYSVSGNVKVAIAYNSSGFVFYVNGTLRFTGTAVVFSNAMSVFTFNHLGIAASITNAAALWKTRLTNDELERLTGTGFNTYAEMANYYNYITQ